MEITVNGERHQLAGEQSLAQLVEELELTRGRIAIELNGDIVPRSHFSQQLLRHGDVVEIVQAIGGG